jgi:hypothetical protein
MEKFKLQILSTPEIIKEYILAGKATFKIENSKTNNNFIYKFKQAQGRPHVYWVYVMVIENGMMHYVYIGGWSKKQGYLHAESSIISIDDQRVLAIDYYVKKLFGDGLSDNFKTYHLSKCGRCGRPLTDSETGIGPECTKNIHSHKNNENDSKTGQ